MSCHGAKGGTYAHLFGTMLRFSGRKVARFYSAHGGSLHFDAATMHGRIIFRIERLLEQLTDRIIFVSAYKRGVDTKKVGSPRCGDALIYNGLRESEFEPAPIDGGATNFLFIGEMRALKGPDIFIGALGKASATCGCTLRGVMVGDGKDRTALVEQAKASGFGENIHFLMPMKAREAFQLARAVVIPSRAEALPYIVLEALVAERPVIASRVGGIPEILGHSSPALVEPEIDSLAATMAGAICDLGALAAFVVAGVALVLFVRNPSPKFRLRIIIIKSGLAVALIVVAILIALQAPSVSELFTSRAQLVQDYDEAQFGRFARHWYGMLVSIDHPLGIGPLEFGPVFGEDTHNIWLKASLDYGWIGFISYLTLTMLTLGLGLRILFRARPWQPYMLCAYLVYVAHVAIGNIIDTDHWRLFWLLVGIIWGCVALEMRHQARNSSLAAETGSVA